MLLSIIVPVYNMAKDGMLEYCLDSLINQTVSDYEIIAVNDASTDNSIDILKDYQEKYPEKIVVVDLPENHHQGGAKNFGLKICKGDYIGFIDSDDWIAPDYYETMINRAEETGADIVACDFCYVHEHTDIPTERVACNKPEQTGEMTVEKMKALIMDPGASVTKVYKRSVLFDEPFEFPDKMFFEDNATYIEIVRRAKHFEYVERPMYFYYQRATSTVHTVTKERCEDRLKAMRIMLQYAIDKGYLETYRDEIEYKFTNLFYQNTLFSYMQEGKNQSIGFIRSMGKEIKKCFPEFEKNPYYLDKVHPEEKKLMHMQQKSTFMFYVYYKLLYFYRGIRKRI